jgi:hypothetical protein
MTLSERELGSCLAISELEAKTATTSPSILAL